MRCGVDSPGKTANHPDSTSGKLLSQVFCDVHPIGSTAARTNNRDSMSFRNIQVTTEIKQQRRVRNFPEQWRKTVIEIADRIDLLLFTLQDKRVDARARVRQVLQSLFGIPEACQHRKHGASATRP